MNDLEAELERLPVRKPSSRLDDRVFAQRPPQPTAGWSFRIPRSPRWVIAWSLATCLFGFILGRASSPALTAQPQEASKSAHLAVAFAFPGGKQLFDATVPTKPFGSQDWIVTTSEKESSK
jgi:hypothetical protein